MCLVIKDCPKLAVRPENIGHSAILECNHSFSGVGRLPATTLCNPLVDDFCNTFDSPLAW